MKINTQISKFIYAAAFTAAFFTISSCKKDTASTSGSVSEMDAAQVTSDAVSPDNGGMVAQVRSSANIYQGGKLSCGTEKDSVYSIASPAGASPAYSYKLTTTSLLTCNGLAASSYAFNFNGAGTYDGPRMSASVNSTGAFVLTGFGAASTQYLVSSTYNRIGTSTSKIANQYTFNSNLTVTSTNIVVDKTTDEIVSGTATVTLTATSTSGRSVTYNGTITFLGNKQAKVVLNSGTNYAIQWN